MTAARITERAGFVGTIAIVVAMLTGHLSFWIGLGLWVVLVLIVGLYDPPTRARSRDEVARRRAARGEGR